MMKTLVVVLALPLLLGAGRPKDKPSDKDVHALVDRAFRAIGGEKKLAAIQVATMTSVVTTADGSKTTIKYFVQKPDKLRLETTGTRRGKKVKELIVVNGDNVWFVSDGEHRTPASGAAQRLRRTFVRYFPADPLFLVLKNPDVTLTLLPEMKIDGQAAVGIKAVSERGIESRLFFAKATGRLLERQFQLPDGKIRSSAFSDYKLTGGVNVPWRRVDTEDGKPLGKHEIVRFEIVKALDSKLFEKP